MKKIIQIIKKGIPSTHQNIAHRKIVTLPEMDEKINLQAQLAVVSTQFDKAFRQFDHTFNQ